MQWDIWSTVSVQGKIEKMKSVTSFLAVCRKMIFKNTKTDKCQKIRCFRMWNVFIDNVELAKYNFDFGLM